MSTDDKRLIEAIIARPEEDAPRFAYADWLTQQGDPRGELIALSLEHAKRPSKANEKRLLQLHDTIRTPLRELLLGGYFYLRRGFVEHVECVHFENYVKNAEVLQQKAPLLRSFQVSYGTVEIVNAAPMVHEIWPPGFLHLREITVLAEAKSARDLRKVKLVKSTPDTDTMMAIAELPQAIEELDLGFDGRLVDFDRTKFSARLAGRTHPLRELELKQVKVMNDSCEALAKVRGLKKLVLQNADMKSGGILALAEGLDSLVVLDVSENYAESYAQDLPAGRLLDLASPTLRELRLNKLGLGDTQAIEIAASRSSAKLTHLDLARNKIGDQGALALARSEYLHNLIDLNLSANAISAGTKALLRKSPNFAGTKLQLR